MNAGNSNNKPDILCKMGLFFNAFVVLPLATVLVLMFAPGIPPYDVEYGPTKFVRRPLEGQLALNEKFKHAEILPSVVRGGTRLGAFQVRMRRKCN